MDSLDNVIHSFYLHFGPWCYIYRANTNTLNVLKPVVKISWDHHGPNTLDTIFSLDVDFLDFES